MSSKLLLSVSGYGECVELEFGSVQCSMRQVNAIPVFQESDFRFVMKAASEDQVLLRVADGEMPQDALRKHETTGESTTWRAGHSWTRKGATQLSYNLCSAAKAHHF